MKKVLMIVGSLRKDSFNLQLAKVAEEILKGQAEVRYLHYADMPFMNQDMEFPTPESVARVRQEVLAADGIWIFSPEYNYQIPGVLKNLLFFIHDNGLCASGANVNSHKILHTFYSLRILK